MILRPPNWLDFEFFKGCYSDWPVTEKNPPILESHIWEWIRRWMNRSDEVCRVGEVDGYPVGFILYRRGRPGAVDMSWAVMVDNIAVHPDHRGKGYSSEIVRVLRDTLVADGVKVAHFEAIPGPIAEQIRKGKFREIGEHEGKTGTVILGELTADMDV